jgi:hypothetical protein
VTQNVNIGSEHRSDGVDDHERRGESSTAEAMQLVNEYGVLVRLFPIEPTTALRIMQLWER